MTDIPERLRAIVSSPEVNPPLGPLLAIADDVQVLANELADAKEQLRIATATARALSKYADQQDDTLSKVFDLLNNSDGQSLAMFTVQELYPEDTPPPPGAPAPPEPVYCEECDNDITYDCSTCAPVVDSSDFVELPETD